MSLKIQLITKYNKCLKAMNRLNEIQSRISTLTRLALCFTIITMATIGPVAADDCVVLLHGMARTPASMDKMGEMLGEEGFQVVNLGYPSRKKTIAELAPLAVDEGLDACPESTEKVHFVTHSLGGILVRYYLDSNEIKNLGRVVMLAPPNQGSQVVDAYRDLPGYDALNGPAGQQLGTDEESVPLNLPPVEFDLGVIAGTRTINPILSLELPNPDDGKVSVENTKVEGMNDFLETPHSHPLIMKSSDVIEQVTYYLNNGHFNHVEKK